jgi:hypothetical protein
MTSNITGSLKNEVQNIQNPRLQKMFREYIVLNETLCRAGFKEIRLIDILDDIPIEFLFRLDERELI